MTDVDAMTACAEAPELFDDPGEAGSDLARYLARKCAVCPVLQACGRYALTNVVAGFAAGMTERERRRLLRKRKPAPAVAAVAA